MHTHKKYIFYFLLWGIMTLTTAEEILKAYVQEKSIHLDWQEKEQKNEITLLKITTQKWQDMIWKHRVFVIKPKKSTKKETTAMIWVTGSGNGKKEIKYAKQVVERTQMPVFILMDVPNQPLYGGLREDALIVYTIKQALKTKKMDWILLFPMVKSVVSAMDIIQKYYFEKNQVKIGKFVITGASKRGWTTWLTAYVDKRVHAIIPIVYDNLNLKAQMQNQIKKWGKFSYKISDYSSNQLPSLLKTNQGAYVGGLIDPYSYRKFLSLPKIIVIGTNDHYWPLNSLNLYYKELEKPSYVVYVPNNGHQIKNYDQVTKAMSSALLWCEKRYQFPNFSWNITQEGKYIRVLVDGNCKKLKLWMAMSSTKDFRSAKWRSRFIEKRARITKTDATYIAVYLEAIFEGKVSYCSNVYIFKSR